MDSSYILEIRLRGSILRKSLAPPGLLQAFVAGLAYFVMVKLMVMNCLPFPGPCAVIMMVEVPSVVIGGEPQDRQAAITKTNYSGRPRKSELTTPLFWPSPSASFVQPRSSRELRVRVRALRQASMRRQRPSSASRLYRSIELWLVVDAKSLRQVGQLCHRSS
jgi:hypothetical protein